MANFPGSGVASTVTSILSSVTNTITTMLPTGRSLDFGDTAAMLASAFKAGDAMSFATMLPAGLGFSVAPAAGTADGLVTLSLGGVSRTFDVAALHASAAAGLLTLADGGKFYVSSTAGDSFSLNSDLASAIHGLAGADLFRIAGLGAHLVDAGAGNDTIAASGLGALLLAGGAGADLIDAATALGNLHIYGNAASTAQGTTDGNDTIAVGLGSNYVNGNAGDDLITVASGAAASLNRLNGGGGNDTIVGGDGIDLVNGNLGNDSIQGGGGDDLLRGGQGDDILSGGLGNDQLFGDLGNDTLVGGAGLDVLTGGAGADLFRFAAGDAPPPATAGSLAGYTDEITDFTPGSDHIDLALLGTGAVATANLMLGQTGSAFGTVAAAQAYAQQLLDASTSAASAHDIALVQVGADTYLFAHEASNAHGAAIDTVIKLDRVTATTLTTADFV